MVRKRVVGPLRASTRLFFSMKQVLGQVSGGQPQTVVTQFQQINYDLQQLYYSKCFCASDLEKKHYHKIRKLDSQA